MSTKPAKAWQVVDKQTKVVLVTAFEPFGDSDVNASETVLRQLEQTLDDLRTGILPVRKNSVHKALAGLIEQHTPDALIMLGEAGPNEEIRLELVALNHDDFRMPDNDGLTVDASRIVDSGPDAYFSNIDVHSVASSLPTNGDYAPSTISLSAGSFLCNHTYFLARHFHGNLPAVFVHIPCLRDETHTAAAFERVSNTVNCIVQEITATLTTSTTD
jgi:pyroglutamyl-peptidase